MWLSESTMWMKIKKKSERNMVKKRKKRVWKSWKINKGHVKKQSEQRKVGQKTPMKRGKNIFRDVKDGIKSLKKIYPNVPHFTLSLHYKPRKSYRDPRV